MSLKQLMFWPVVTFALAYALIFSVSTFATSEMTFPGSLDSGHAKGEDAAFFDNKTHIN